jgi:hypothetical protein
MDLPCRGKSGLSGAGSWKPKGHNLARMARDRCGGTGFSRQACPRFTPVLDCSVWIGAGGAMRSMSGW